jgi:hypothetical protein
MIWQAINIMKIEINDFDFHGIMARRLFPKKLPEMLSSPPLEAGLSAHLPVNTLGRRSTEMKSYFPFIFVIVLANASPFRSMAYSTVSFEPMDQVCRSVS